MATANSRASTVSLHLNRGNGTFRRRIAYGVAGYITAALWSVAIGDLNMDGRADLVAGNADDRSRAVSVFVNRGHGRFESKLDFGSDTAASWGMHAVGVADLNRDRKPDIALVVGYRTVAVLLNRPGSGLSKSSCYRSRGGRSPASTAASGFVWGIRGSSRSTTPHRRV